MFMETDELDTVLDARFERHAELAGLADQIEREVAKIVSAMRPPALPEHGSIPDALWLVARLSHARASESPRVALNDLFATAFKLAFDNAEAEGATYEQMGDAAGMARSNVHKYRHAS